METGGPPKIRRVGYRDIPAAESTRDVNPIRVIAGIGAILFPLLNLLTVPFLFMSMLSPHESNPAIGVIFMFAYALLLPLVYVLYQELSAASRPLGAAVSVLGLGAPIGVVGGVIGAVHFLNVQVIVIACLSLWIGLTGILAFWRRILNPAWALFSAAIGALVLLAGILVLVGAIEAMTISSILLIYILAVATWAVWTGIMFLLRARMTPAGA